MSEKQINTRFKLSHQELITLVDWILFQDELSDVEIDFADKIWTGKSLLDNSGNKYNCFYLRAEECELAVKWYDNLLDCLLDRSDVGLHVALNIYLDELAANKNELSADDQA